MKNNRRNHDKNTLLYLGLISQIGFSIITPILLGLIIGQFLDKKLGRNGIFSIIFIILGAITGFYYLIKLSTRPPKNK